MLISAHVPLMIASATKATSPVRIFPRYLGVISKWSVSNDTVCFHCPSITLLIRGEVCLERAEGEAQRERAAPMFFLGVDCYIAFSVVRSQMSYLDIVWFAFATLTHISCL
jgi:hypothetical protein